MDDAEFRKTQPCVKNLRSKKDVFAFFYPNLFFLKKLPLSLFRKKGGGFTFQVPLLFREKKGDGSVSDVDGGFNQRQRSAAANR